MHTLVKKSRGSRDRVRPGRVQVEPVWRKGTGAAWWGPDVGGSRERRGKPARGSARRLVGHASGPGEEEARGVAGLRPGSRELSPLFLFIFFSILFPKELLSKNN